MNHLFIYAFIHSTSLLGPSKPGRGLSGRGHAQMQEPRVRLHWAGPQGRASTVTVETIHRGYREKPLAQAEQQVEG